MRIAVWHNLPSGGGKRALYDHVRGLVARGHTVETWAPPSADRSYLPLEELALGHIVPWDRPLVSEAGFLGWSLNPSRRAVAELDAAEHHARRCAEEINRGGFDVVFANTCQYLFSPDIARHVDPPTVLYLQEPCRSLYEAMPWDQEGSKLPWIALSPAPRRRASPAEWKRRLTASVRDFSEVRALRERARRELINARACRKILCNSLFSRESIKRAYGLESEVSYLGVDTIAFEPALTSKEPFVVGLGSMSHHKGLDLAIQAVSRIEPHSRPRLVWIGNATSEDYLSDMNLLASTLGVEFVPRVLVSHVELTETLSQAAALVYTSRLEPFGFAPLEANACGTVAVAMAEGGIRETVSDGVNGDLVAPGDIGAVARALEKYTGNLSLARKAGLRAREHVVSAWSVVSACDRLEQHLIEGGGPCVGQVLLPGQRV